MVASAASSCSLHPRSLQGMVERLSALPIGSDLHEESGGRAAAAARVAAAEDGGTRKLRTWSYRMRGDGVGVSELLSSSTFAETSTAAPEEADSPSRNILLPSMLVEGEGLRRTGGGVDVADVPLVTTYATTPTTARRRHLVIRAIGVPDSVLATSFARTPIPRHVPGGPLATRPMADMEMPRVARVAWRMQGVSEVG